MGMGAGAVGIELVGEILDKYSKKKVILMDMSKTILPGFHKSSIKYAYNYLQNNNVEMKLGVSIKEMGDKYVVLDNGERIEVDIIYKCYGSKPNTEFLKESSVHPIINGPKGALLLNDYLQLLKYNFIYCAGDICHHALSNEIKLGHTAEVNGHLVAKNIVKSINGSEKLLEYPYGVVGNSKTPFIYNLSLGKYDATLGFNNLVINGFVADIMKWMIKYTKVAAAERRPIGIFFWEFADSVSNLLGRTILS